MNIIFVDLKREKVHLYKNTKKKILDTPKLCLFLIDDISEKNDFSSFLSFNFRPIVRYQMRPNATL